MSLGSSLDPATVVAVTTAGSFVAAGGAYLAASRRPAPPTWAERHARGGRIPEFPALRIFEYVLVALLAGYAFFDRAFAWIHVPGTPLFLSEMALAFGLFAVLGTHPRLGEAARRSAAFRALAAYMIWGAGLLAVSLPRWGLDAVRDSVLWYYGAVAIYVVVLVRSRPDRIRRWLRWFGLAIPALLVWGPIAVVLDAVYDDRVPLVPDSEIPIVAHRTGNVLVLTGMAVAFLWLVDHTGVLYDRRQRNFLTALATAAVIFSAMRNRGGFVAVVIGLVVVLFFLRRRRSELTVVMVGAAVLLLTVGLLSDVRLALFGDREVSVEQLVANLESVVDPDSGGKRQSSTTKWRLEIWERVFEDVTTEFPIAGFGPGPDLGERYGITTDENVPLRNPHNSHVHILARMGYVGIALWAILWVAWIREMLGLRRRLARRGRRTEAAAAVWILVSAVAILVNAVFDPTLEGPQVGWWLWSLFGLGVAMTLLERRGVLPDLHLGRRPRRFETPVAP